MAGLNPKQERFVSEYLVDLNASQAAIRAGYSKDTAGSIGHELLKKPEIAAAIQAGRAKLSERTGITAERVLKELERIAFASPRDVMTWGPGGVVLRDSEELTEDEAAIVSEVAETKDGLRLKLHSKTDALDKLAKHLGIYAAEKHEHTGKDGAPIEVANLSANERARRLAFVLAQGVRAAKKPAA